MQVSEGFCERFAAAALTDSSSCKGNASVLESLGVWNRTKSARVSFVMMLCITGRGMPC